MDISSPSLSVPPMDISDDEILRSFSNMTKEATTSFVASLNGTMPKVACLLMEAVREKTNPVPFGACEAGFDGLICWPATRAGSTAISSCIKELNGIEYNTTQNASRWCNTNGTWDTTNYSDCLPLTLSDLPEAVEITTTIYFVGYISSLIALNIAVWIFTYFKDLRCLRNVIHTNLMCTYILTDFAWILNATLQMSVETNMATCVFLMILLHYFSLTNFFWMFVEGLYLYMLVVETFTGENIKLRVYASIGWGFPAVFIVVWAIVKVFTSEDTSTLESVGNPWKHCPWMRPHICDWIYQAPAIGILLVNLVFLFLIMWVLITKLRSAQTVETQRYRKAAKALLVLIPLLGITYVLVISGPTDGVYKNIYDIVLATLISTQGFTVALFFCFLNTEVQNTIRHFRDRWKTARSFRGSRRYTYSGQSKDWSPRSRTESIRPSISYITDSELLTQRNSFILTDTHTNPRLYSQPSTYRKRESSASEVTTTTLVNVNGGSRVSNGSQARTPFLHPPGGTEVV